MNTTQKHRFDFLESNPHQFNNMDNSGFARPYILDFSPLANSYRYENFDILISRNQINSVTTPYTLLIQVALSYLDSKFSSINNDAGRHQFKKLVKHIFNSLHSKGNTAFFIHNHPKVEYGLNPGWSSAMTQGQALSLWIRLMALKEDFEDIKHIGPLLLNGMLKKVEEGGGLHKDRLTGETWLEEYPSTPPSHVLNGYIFAFFGLLEFNRCDAFNNSNDHLTAEICLNETLSNNIYRYDQFGWSRYDLAKRNFAPTLYHLIHIYTLNYLSIMLDNDCYSVIATKWREGLCLNKYNVIDTLRFARAAYRKAFVTFMGKPW